MVDHENILCYICRHGSTEMNEQNIFRGDSNPSLSPKGIQEAHQLAYYLKDLDFSYIFTSNKNRAVETAKIINEKRESPIEITQVEGLVPWNVGKFGGLPKTEEIVKQLQWYIDNPDICVPEGCSLNEFRSRVGPLLMEAADLALVSEYPILMVLHSSVIHEVGEVFGEHHEDAHVKPGGVAAIFIDPKTGYLDVEPIFKPDKRSNTQNILGVNKSRAGLNS